jgi:hypothetical protein
MVNQNLLIVFGKPTDSRVRRFMQIRYEDADYRAFSDDFRIMAIPTDTDRLAAAQTLVDTRMFDLNLNAGRDPLFFVLVDSQSKTLAILDSTQLCQGETFSKELLFSTLEKFRPKPMDAQVLLDEALKKAAKENKRVLIQETATWCGPCHRFSRLLNANRQWEQDYVWVKMDQRWTGAEEIMQKIRDGADGGIPWFAILNASGDTLVTSNLPESGENIGFPSEPSGQEHFAKMLKATRQRMSDQEIQALVSAIASQE